MRKYLEVTEVFYIFVDKFFHFYDFRLKILTFHPYKPISTKNILSIPRKAQQHLNNIVTPV